VIDEEKFQQDFENKESLLFNDFKDSPKQE